MLVFLIDYIEVIIINVGNNVDILIWKFILNRLNF